MSLLTKAQFFSLFMAKDTTPILKKLDAPAEVILVDPVTVPVAKLLAGLKVHPITITFIAFLFRSLAGVLFITSHLKIGALSSVIGYYLDGIDGKIARLRHLDEELHGTTDFLLDQLAFGIMGIGAIIWSVNNANHITSVLIACWLALYMVFMAYTSTLFRILSQHQINYEDIKNNMGPSFFSRSQTPANALFKVLQKPADLYFKLKKKASKYRMSPYFGAIESEIFIFMLAPFFNFNYVLIAFSIIFLLPDTLFTTVLIYLKVLDLR